MEDAVSAVRDALFRLRDEDYRTFQLGLLPTVAPNAVIGVRTPALRGLAKELARQGQAAPFLETLPHAYFDENQLHAFILSDIRDLDACLREVERFLPFVDNWATCDQLSPKVFRKNRQALPDHAARWTASGHTYTIRFGVGTLMTHFLDEDFDDAYPALVAGLRSEEYYVNMMIAWYFATALAKQYERALPYLEANRLDAWTHNKAIQKAIESRRVPDAHKAYLRTLRR